MGLHRATVLSCALILCAAISGLGTLAVGFAPGSGVPKHVHGGPVVATVISGELTLQQGGGEKIIKAGESWTEKTGDVHAVVNRSEGVTRVVVSLLLPKGAAATTLVK
ncbi:MAG: cupin domain-containing protein [Bacillati bacterium ANGP1]|uniref:Cupin domain-containing protein n=1 Tax=Candidatus Segetimicrobium genomatis TaxID=2569760 RepID=A0A537M0J0_9BACT|nr:MAG: cupin domain-containing protein [Terrabacteria group bacterium ANGP1]